MVGIYVMYVSPARNVAGMLVFSMYHHRKHKHIISSEMIHGFTNLKEQTSIYCNSTCAAREMLRGYAPVY